MLTRLLKIQEANLSFQLQKYVFHFQLSQEGGFEYILMLNIVLDQT